MATDPPCDPPSETIHGKAPVVLDEFGCLTQLVMLDSSEYPAIEQAISDSLVELRNGSSRLPFSLPHLQKQVGGSFAKMMVQDAAGKWYAFTPTTGCVNQRLIISDGSFTFVEDVIPSLLTSEICAVSSCDEYDYLLGAKLITVDCYNGGTKQYLKPVLVPRVLCPECPSEP